MRMAKRCAAITSSVSRRCKVVSLALNARLRMATYPRVCLFNSAPHSSAQTSLQETTLEIDFYDGFRHQIHPPIITLHAKLITTVQLNGFFKIVDIINGNLLAPSCGYAENVRYASFSACNDPRPSLISIAGSGKSVLWFALRRLLLPLLN
jgi:hypothetical protein